MTSSRPQHKRVPPGAGDLLSGRSTGVAWIGRGRVLHLPAPGRLHSQITSLAAHR